MYSIVSFSQKKDSYDALISEADTINVVLEEVSVLPPHKFKSKTDVAYFKWFKKKVFKAYPYAYLMSQRLDTLNARLSRIDSKRKKRKYTKRVQKYVEKELTAPLKKLTKTEGRILLKLIHRQTGKTAYNNIRFYRSGWKAFWYNATANVFSLSLKVEYHPESDNEDYLIEDILQRAFYSENLKSQNSKINIDSFNFLDKTTQYINVDRYKKMFAKLNKRRKRKK